MPTNTYFDGSTYEPELDKFRLSSQLERVVTVMNDKEWHTLQELVDRAGPGSMPAMSARLRDLRKERFGSYTIERRRISGGLFEYRMV
jgi:hypothetical protein